VKLFEGEINQELVVYSYFKHIIVILVPPCNQKTFPIEKVKIRTDRNSTTGGKDQRYRLR